MMLSKTCYAMNLLENSSINVSNEDENKERLISFLNSLSKEDLEKLWFDYSNIHKAATYSNPVTIAMMSHINEGLIHTYPIEKTIKYIKDYFGFSDKQIVPKLAENGVYHIWVCIPNVENNLNLVTRAMSACGYYLGSPREEAIPRDEWVWLQYEPKNQEDASKQIREEETTLLHLTPIYNLGKILHIGFSPRCKNELFNYPSRVYFLRGSTTKEDIINIGEQLCDSNSSLGNTGNYALFTIDISKIPNNVKFFLDPNYPYGVYTNSNITPSAIVNYEKLSF